MGSTIQIGQRNSFNRFDLRAIHVLRAKVFRDRMGWEVPVLAGMEIDGCRPGKHWSLEGQGIAHCVDDDIPRRAKLVAFV